MTLVHPHTRTSIHRRRAPRLLTAVACLGMSVVWVPAQVQAQEGDVVAFSEGHVDAFHVSAEGSGLLLDLKEDVTGSGVRHAPEDVLLEVSEDAWSDATSGVDGIGQQTYFLPQTQDQNLLWPGWDTQLAGSAGYEEVTFHFDKVTGPGQVFVFETAGFGDVKTVTNSGNMDIVSGESITQPYPAHRHVNWAFTEPGTYTMRVVAESGGVESNAATYTWAVGNGEASAQSASPAEGGRTDAGSRADSGAASGGATDGERSATAPARGGRSGDSGQTAGAGTESSGDAAGGQRRVVRANPSSGGAAAGGASSRQGADGNAGGGDTSPQCVPGLNLKIKDDTVSPAEWVDAEGKTFYLPSEAETNLPQALGPIAQGKVWMIGSTQQAGVPWLGANTQHPTVREHTSGPVTWELVDYSGPGAMYVYEQGGLGQIVGKEWFAADAAGFGGAIDVPENSHVHPNWMFSQPGTYSVKIKQTATARDGSLKSGVATLKFAVGGDKPAGAFDNGHYDFGAEVNPQGGDCAVAAGKGASASDAGADRATTQAANAQPSPVVQSAISEPTLLIVGVSVLALGMLAVGGGAGALAWQMRGRKEN